MKKLLCLLLCLLLAMALVACSADDADDDSSSRGSDTSDKADDKDNDEETDADVAAKPAIPTFKAPANVAKINMNAADPSNSAIRFNYDDEGKVTGCVYEVDGQTMNAVYTYEDGSVQIYVFAGSTLVADEQITLSSAYDANGGFSIIDGFYFKGF